MSGSAHNSGATLESNAKVSFQCELGCVLFKVSSPLTDAYLEQLILTGNVAGLLQESMGPEQHRQKHQQPETVGRHFLSIEKESPGMCKTNVDVVA